MLTRHELSEQKYGFPNQHTPMVGRKLPLASLKCLLDGVKRTHRGHVALISGAEGFGKSRLVSEFCQLSKAVVTQTYIGRCLHIANRTPYRVVADLLRDMINISAMEPAPFQYKILEKFVNHKALPRQEVLPYLINLFGLDAFESNLRADLGHLDTTMLQRQTHVAIRRILKAQILHSPTIFVLEDLHWIDPASSALLAYLLRNLHDIPVLFLLTTEDKNCELLHPLFPVVANKTVWGEDMAENLAENLAENEQTQDKIIGVADGFMAIELGPLSMAEGAALVEQLISVENSDATILKQRVMEQAAGNPFYAEELVRFAVDCNVLIGTSSHWKITAEMETFLDELPTSPEALILARFKLLSGARPQILHQAAVLGYPFSKRLIQRLNHIRFDTMIVLLTELVERQFLITDPDGLEVVYTFSHNLTRQVVYNTLSEGIRQSIHTVVAETLEENHHGANNDQAETLAYQYYHSAIPERALPYLLTSIGNAARRSANLTVIQYGRMALDLYSDEIAQVPMAELEDLFSVQIELGRALKFVGTYTEGTQILQTTLANIQKQGSVQKDHPLLPKLVDCLRELADIQIREGDYNRAITYLKTGLEVIADSTSHTHRQLRRLLMDRKAWVNFRLGNLQKAIDIACAATLGTDSEQRESQALLANLYNTLGGICWQQGELPKAIKFVELSRKLYRDLGYSWGVAVAYINLGVLNVSQGDWLKAVSIYEQTLALLEEIGNIEHRALVLGNLGDLSLLLGTPEIARTYLTESLAIRQRLGDAWGVAYCHTNLAHIALTQSHINEAETHARTAITLSKERQNTEFEINASWILALVQAERASASVGLSTALSTATDALLKAQSAGLVEKEAECLRVVGMLSAQVGEIAQAEIHLRESIELCQQLKDRYRQGLAHLELARIRLLPSMPSLRAEEDLSKRASYPQNGSRSTQYETAQYATAQYATAQIDLNQAIAIFESLGAAHDLKIAKQIQLQLNHTTQFDNPATTH